MANLPTAHPASAFAAPEQTTVWIPLPEAMGICAGTDGLSPQANPQAPVGRLWAQMRGSWLKARYRAG